MNFNEWMNKNSHNLQWYDYASVKIGMIALALMVAKLWSDILYLEWYWYLLIFLVFMIRPFLRFFGK
jgi:hypothetical protein